MVAREPPQAVAGPRASLLAGRAFPELASVLARSISWALVAGVALVALVLLGSLAYSGREWSFSSASVLGVGGLALSCIVGSRLVRILAARFTSLGESTRMADYSGSFVLLGTTVLLYVLANSTAAPAFVALLVLLEESSWYVLRQRMLRPTASPARPLGTPLPVEETAEAATDRVSDDGWETVGEQEEMETEAPLLPAGVQRQWTRELLEDGRVKLHGLVRGRMEAGERVQAVHVEFCPPYAADPTVTAYVVEGAGVDVRVTQAACFGARWEWHRSASAAQEATEVITYFEAIGRE